VSTHLHRKTDGVATVFNIHPVNVIQVFAK